ncbi:MAG: MFS transporter [Betaproteobacteria bacterium]|nr:MFS transporter [Burkholderiaceae bacterium]MCZ8175997.1 MFS transporter [Burkholderiaceae bacterium]
MSPPPRMPGEAPPDLGPARDPRSARTAAYALGVLVTAAVFAAVNRQILVLLGEPIRQSLGLSDTQLGLLQGLGVTLFCGLAAVPIGWLADRFGRRRLLALCIVVWSAATAACGMAQDFTALFAAAAVLGIGEAGLTPIVYGLLPDAVPARRRALANGIFTLAVILGAGLGIAFSGAIVQALGSASGVLPPALQGLEAWRLAFLFVALPGPLVALLVLLIPVRRGAAVPPGAAAPPGRSPTWDYLRQHRRTVVGIFGGTGLAALGLAAVSNWLPVVATRRFGASAAEVGQGVGLGYIVGTLVGAAGGAWAVRRLAQRHGVATPVRVTVWSIALGSVAAAAMPLAADARQLYLLFGLQVAALIAASVLAPTLLQDMTPAAQRSRLIAVGGLVSVSMSSLSPPLVGLISDALGAAANGLLAAMAAVSALAMAGGALLVRTAEHSFVGTVKAVRHGQPDAP